MFMVKENIAQKERLEKIYKKVELLYGVVVPQMKFLGSIEASYVEDFLKMVLRVVKHEHIAQDIFTFIRLHIAYQESYVYCKKFNTQMLLLKGYKQELLDEVIEDIEQIPFSKKERRLAFYAVKAIYESQEFSQENFDELYGLGWSQKDVFDAIEHAGTIFKNGRILNAYMRKG